MQKKIIQRIEAELECPGLFKSLVERCSLPDLTSLLLEVYREKTKKITPKALLQQYANNSYVQPAKTNVLGAMKFDQFAASLLPKDFEMIELSTVAPLGSNSAIATVDQNNALSTIRNTEVCSDPTNVMALESALRIKRLSTSKRHQTIKLCASQRVVRCQKFKEANCLAHFRLLTLTTAGRDEGSFKFEIASLYEHISYFIDLLIKSQILGVKLRDLSVQITALDESRLEVLQQNVVDDLAAKHERVMVKFNQKRETGRGYYIDACYQIYSKDANGNDLLLVDGGFTNWTKQLLSNQKERFLVSGLGSERLLVST